jgi:LemA protein
MLNQNGPISQGNDVNVLNQTVAVRDKIGVGSTIFVVILWILGIIPGVIFLFISINAKNYLKQLQQKIQANASQVDNFLEQRVQILNNAAAIVTQAVELDKDVMIAVAEARGGGAVNNDNRNQVAGNVDRAMRAINVAFEQYPDLKAHAALADAMRQNSYLQREITAARGLYNDAVLQWNTDIFRWPAKMIQAAKMNATTWIPFSATAETREQARGTFF